MQTRAIFKQQQATLIKARMKLNVIKMQVKLYVVRRLRRSCK